MLRKLRGGFMPPYRDEHGKKVPGSHSELKKLMLGGAEQWITIRGKSRELPILLFLHGGPGSPQIGALAKYNRALEDHYLVVHWDQRGSGKSFSPPLSADSMTIPQLLTDLYELVVYLKKEYGKEKIFLAGQSCGAAIGLLFIKKHPELVHAYVGINQPVFRAEEERRSYDFVLQTAKEKMDVKAYKRLEDIGRPEKGTYNSINDMVTQRKYVTKYRGVAHKKNAALINMNYLLSPHLHFKEKLLFMKRFGFSSTHLWDEFTALNFFQLVPAVEVPIYIIAGLHDQIVPFDLVEKYYKELAAPFKQLIVFEESAHLACFEEAGRFNEIMAADVIREAEKKVVERAMV